MFLISTQAVLFQLGWLYFGFSCIGFSICAKKKSHVEVLGDDTDSKDLHLYRISPEFLPKLFVER